jgi:hypothetical protein
VTRATASPTAQSAPSNPLKSPPIEEAALGKARRRVPSDACAGRIALTPPRMPFSAVPSGFRFGSELPVLAPSPPVISLITANYLPVNVLFHDPAFFRSRSWNSRRFRNETRSETPNSPCFPPVSRPQAPPGGAIAARKCRRRLPANACSRRIAPTPRMLCSWLGIRSAALRLASARGHGARSPRLAESV